MPLNSNTLNTRDLNSLLREYQTGEVQTDNEQVPPVKPPQNDIDEIPNLYKLNQGFRASNGVAESHVDEALSSGYGTSRYDTEFTPGMDVENARAFEQSGFSKIGTGLLKGGVTAVTTGVDTVLGTIAGAITAGAELAADPDDNGRSFMKTIEAGVTNPVSEWLLGMQRKSEEWFPNYRTTEERTEKYQDEWYKHMLTPNFIGDSFLKNFGFTVGAMGGGVAWSKLLGAAMSNRLANNIMKGVAASAAGDAEATASMEEAISTLRQRAAAAAQAGRTAEAAGAEAAIGALERGSASTINVNRLFDNVENAARAINKMDAQMQLYGSVLGAMGEGRMEGIMAKEEFLDDFRHRAAQQFSQEYNNLEQEIIDSGNPDWVDKDRTVLMPDGTVQNVPTLTELGKKHLQVLRNRKEDEYADLQDYANRQAEQLAATTFLLNLPILTASNMVQFGRMFSGGWKTSRKGLSGIKGKTTIGAPAEGTNLPSISADYAATGNAKLKSVLGSLKVAGSESFEEMAQGVVSSGAKNVASSNISTFNDLGYDEGATDSVRNWFADMYTGGADYLSDAKNWQEGALGAITGLFGIPGKKWHGGIVGAVQDANKEVNESREAANRLNTLVNSKEFQDRWHGYIRHLAYDRQMQEALENDDQYAWHTANDNQFVSDIMAFADAGKLEDLNQIISAFGNITAEDAKQIKDLAKNGNNDSLDWTKNLSNEEIVGKVKSQADDMKKVVQDYKNIYDALLARAPVDASPEFIKEMVASAMQIKAYDNRFLTMFGETMNAIDPLLRAESARDDDGNLLTKEESLQKYEGLRSSFEQVFAGSVVPTRAAEELMRQINFDYLDELTKESDPETNEKVNDMKRLFDDRRRFFVKLQTMRENKNNNAQKKFEDEAITKEKVEDKAEQAYTSIETDGLDTVAKVKEAYYAKPASERAGFLSSLGTVSDKNQAVKSFLDLRNRYDAFRSYTASNPIQPSNYAVTPDIIDGMTVELFRRARSEQELINLPDNVFMPWEEFQVKYQGVFPVTKEMYAATKNDIRNAMQAYLSTVNGTAGRHQLREEIAKEEKAKQEGEQPAEKPVTERDHYDSGQPASLAPAPNPLDIFKDPEADNIARDVSLSGETPAPAAAPAADHKEEAPQKYVPQERIVGEDLAAEANDASSFREAFDEEAPEMYAKESEIGTSKRTYYNTGAPQIQSGEAKKARAAIKARDRAKLIAADLSDIEESDPRFKTTNDALKSRGAFDTVAHELKEGDDIELVIDPAFPPYVSDDGVSHYQILLTTVKDGKRKVLNVLPMRTSEYYGLGDLRKAVIDGYTEFSKTHPNQPYVFGKKSKVWAKRAGLIDYDYSGKTERALTSFADYDKDAPIVFINRSGVPVVVHGSDKTAGSKVSDSFDDVNKNIARDKNGRNKVGRMYYLVKNPQGKYQYVPVMLKTAHFNEGNKDDNNSYFEKIRGIATDITKIVHSADNTNLEEKNEQLREKMSELTEYLDTRGIYLEIGNYNNIGTALKFVRNYVPKTGNEEIDQENRKNEDADYRTPDQLSDNWLIDAIAAEDKPVQIRLDARGESVANLNELLENGLLSTNARSLTPKGIDFYIWPYKNGEFAPFSANGGQAIEPTAAEEEAAQPVPEQEKTITADTPDRAIVDNIDELTPDAPEDSGAEEAEPETGEPVAPVGTETGKVKFADLSEDVKKDLLEDGFTEEEFDDMSEEEQQQAIKCRRV